MNKPLPDDDAEVDPAALETAAEETRCPAIAPEIDEQTADLTEWDEAAAAAGSAAPKVGPEDETSAVEQLIEEGLEEADRDQRIAAADPDFEP